MKEHIQDILVGGRPMTKLEQTNCIGYFTKDIRRQMLKILDKENGCD